MLRDMISQLEKSVMGNIAKMYYQFMGELNRMLARVDDLHEDVAPCKRALATISAGALRCQSLRASMVCAMLKK